jgi:molybdopterin-containing oxidoreductase family membrane subunit
MSIGHTALEPGLQPMVDKRPAALTFVGLLSAGTAYWLWTFAHLLTDGHRLLGTDSYGAVWGVTVANVVHLIGISHVGIAVSATVRILRIESYRNFARIAEVMTLVAMGAAVLNIAIHTSLRPMASAHGVVDDRHHGVSPAQLSLPVPRAAP